SPDAGYEEECCQQEEDHPAKDRHESADSSKSILTNKEDSVCIQGHRVTACTRPFQIDRSGALAQVRTPVLRP
ncbi:MAG: hypothetical protein ABSD85_17510, partial [Acidimicrobiales bacterium]